MRRGSSTRAISPARKCRWRSCTAPTRCTSRPMSPSSSTARAAIPRTPSPNGSPAPPAPRAWSTAPTRCTRWCWRNSCARKAAISGCGARETGCERRARFAALRPHLFGQAGNSRGNERSQQDADDLVHIKLALRPGVKIDVIVLLAQLHERQQHIEAVGEAERHAVLGSLSGGVQHRPTQQHEAQRPGERVFEVIAETDRIVEQEQTHPAQSRRRAPLPHLAGVAYVGGFVDQAVGLQDAGKLFVGLWRIGLLAEPFFSLLADIFRYVGQIAISKFVQII